MASYLFVSAQQPTISARIAGAAPEPIDLCVTSPSPTARATAATATNGRWVFTVDEPLLATRERLELAALNVLGEPRRVAILELLRDGERAVGELVGRLGLSQPAVSKHLRVLKDAGLVEARVDAQRRLYRIRPEPLADLDQWLASYRRLWTTHLDRLEDHLGERR
jgi:DNA-binding transcriptional ArsR family regulator